MKDIKTRLTEVLNKELDYNNSKGYDQRYIGSELEHYCIEIIKKNFKDTKKDVKKKKSIDDITIVENEIEYLIDIKSSDIDSKKSMPNMKSVQRVLKLKKPLYYAFISYSSVEKKVINILVVDIFELNWDHLTFGNLGTGQLQIKDTKEFSKSPIGNLTKKEWLERFRNESILFYEKVIKATEKRLTEMKEYKFE